MQLVDKLVAAAVDFPRNRRGSACLMRAASPNVQTAVMSVRTWLTSTSGAPPASSDFCVVSVHEQYSKDRCPGLLLYFNFIVPTLRSLSAVCAQALIIPLASQSASSGTLPSGA